MTSYSLFSTVPTSLHVQQMVVAVSSQPLICNRMLMVSISLSFNCNNISLSIFACFLEFGDEEK